MEIGPSLKFFDEEGVSQFTHWPLRSAAGNTCSIVFYLFTSIYFLECFDYFDGFYVKTSKFKQGSLLATHSRVWARQGRKRGRMKHRFKIAALHLHKCCWRQEISMILS